MRLVFDRGPRVVNSKADPKAGCGVRGETGCAGSWIPDSRSSVTRYLSHVEHKKEGTGTSRAGIGEDEDRLSCWCWF
jgi:hypothetical protein